MSNNTKEFKLVGENRDQPQMSAEQHEKNVHKTAGRLKSGPRWTIFHVLAESGEEEKRLSMSSGEKKSLEPRVRPKAKAGLVFSSSCQPLSSQNVNISAGTRPEEHFCESSSDEGEEEVKQPERHQAPTSEYFEIQKVMKFLKDGDETATVLAICSLMDFDLMKESCQLAICDNDGLRILINLLDMDKAKLKIASLKVLRKISHNVQIQQNILEMGGLLHMLKILDSPGKDLKALAAETIANVTQLPRARRAVRHYGGIKKLVQLLDSIPNSAKLRSNVDQDMEVVRCGVLALWSFSKSTKNKVVIAKAGAIPLLGRLLKSPHESILVPVMGTLQECASEENCRIAMKTEGMIMDVVKNMHRDNDQLQLYCARAILKVTDNEKTCDLVRRCQGLQLLVSLLRKTDNKPLLVAVTGAIWKCSESMENIAAFQDFNTVGTLVRLLTKHPKEEELLINITGALGGFARGPASRATLLKGAGIKLLINQFKNSNHRALLVNVAKAVGACATDKDNVKIIDQLEGFIHMWNLLSHSYADVQSAAAWALYSCLKNAKNVGQMIRPIISGLDLIINLLKSTNTNVLTSVCAAISIIARDEENLRNLTDIGVVPLLSKLTSTTDDKFRRYLTEAIGVCSIWDPNRASFGESGAVGPLVNYLKSEDGGVQRFTAMALYELSKNQHNIITMHKEGAVKLLVHLIGSDDKELQEYAAGCVENIRLLATARSI